MRLLLDSNVFLWLLTNRAFLTRRTLALLEDDSNEMFVSSASLWELAIKVAKGKLILPGSSVASLYKQATLIGVTILPITTAHILRTETLPHHHRDPFDRMIVAQAIEENLTILTSDSEIPRYSVPVIW